nr:hypothetical protein [Frankia sp. AgB1.8]
MAPVPVPTSTPDDACRSAVGAWPRPGGTVGPSAGTVSRYRAVWWLTSPTKISLSATSRCPSSATASTMVNGGGPAGPAPGGSSRAAAASRLPACPGSWRTSTPGLRPGSGLIPTTG